MQESFYPEKIMWYLLNLPNSGEMPVDAIDNSRVFSTEVGGLEKGMLIKLFLELAPDLDEIKQIKYLAYGDGYTIAALGKLSEDLPGQKLKQALGYSMMNLSKELDIPPAKANNLKLIKNSLEKLISKIILK